MIIQLNGANSAITHNESGSEGLSTHRKKSSLLRYPSLSPIPGRPGARTMETTETTAMTATTSHVVLIIHVVLSIHGKRPFNGTLQFINLRCYLAKSITVRHFQLGKLR